MHPHPDGTPGTGDPATPSQREHEPRQAVTERARPHHRWSAFWLRHGYSPRNWALWRRPPILIVFMVVLEAVAIAIFAVSLARSPASNSTDWTRFAILAAGATLHIQLTQRQEERRRNRTKTVLIDLTAVWTFSAAIILPIPLSLLIVLLIRTQHWFIARRPAHNFIFSSITHGLAGVVAHVTYTAMSAQLPGQPSWGSYLQEFGAIAVAGVVYEAVQILYVGGALALGWSSEPTLRNVLGSTADNVLEAITIGLGAITGILLVVVPPMVAVMAAAAVVFNRLAELDQLRSDVRTDPKTGVLNMRGWSESAGRALERSARSGSTLALFMVDLDHFKWINDTYGHPAGDDVLHSVAETLGETTRPGDLVGRFGGEEFLILLPDIDEAATADVADRIRTAIAKLHVTTTNKRGDATTIADRTTSIGVARFPQDGETLEQLLQSADSAVYEAKENGRNQVRFTGAGHRPGDFSRDPE